MLDLYDAIAAEEVPYPRSQPISYELQVGAQQQRGAVKRGGWGSPGAAPAAQVACIGRVCMAAACVCRGSCVRRGASTPCWHPPPLLSLCVRRVVAAPTRAGPLPSPAAQGSTVPHNGSRGELAGQGGGLPLLYCISAVCTACSAALRACPLAFTLSLYVPCPTLPCPALPSHLLSSPIPPCPPCLHLCSSCSTPG